MKPKHILLLALALSGGFFGCSTPYKQPHQYVTHFTNGELPEVEWFEKASPEDLQNIQAARICLTTDQLGKLAVLPKDPQSGPKWLVEEKPDTMHPGPWKTDFYIFDNTDTNHAVRLEIKNHSSGDIHHTWLNTKILFVEIWWGHAAYTDLILDTETLKFLYIEDGTWMVDANLSASDAEFAGCP